MLKPQLLCMSKAPERGMVKTRLAKDIGDDGAYAVYNELLNRTARVMKQWPHAQHVFFTGNESIHKSSDLGRFAYSRQSNGNLGERLHNAVLQFIDTGPVIVIGTDCPEMSVNDLYQIEQMLDTSDVCLAPSNDGGYWAIGLQSKEQAHICFAADLPWSEMQLLQETGDRLDQAGISHCHGPQHFDLDDIEDLTYAQSRGFPSMDELCI